MHKLSSWREQEIITLILEDLNAERKEKPASAPEKRFLCGQTLKALPSQIISQASPLGGELDEKSKSVRNPCADHSVVDHRI